MTGDLFASLEQRARQVGATIVLPEGDDERVVRAVERLRDGSVIRPMLLGDADAVARSADAVGVDLTGVPVVDPAAAESRDEMASEYASMRGVSERVARRLLGKRLMFAAMMVRRGDADGMVAGAASTTKAVLQSAGLAIGYEPGVSIPSSIMLMLVPDFLGLHAKVLAFADPAVAIDPSPEELAAIAVQSGRTFRHLVGEMPRVALLSFSTKGSGSHPHVEKVVAATRIARNLGADFPIDGELQADAALIPEVAAKKVAESDVAGQANVLVMPDLDAGNIAYKLTQYLAGAEAIGPILQGFQKPVNDLSRGASVDDVVRVATITAVMCR